MKRSVRSVLVIDPSPFGRGLGLLPVLRGFRRSYYGAFVSVVSGIGISELVYTYSLANEAFSISGIGEAGAGFGASMKEIYTLMRRSSHRKFDLTVNLSDHVATQLFCMFSRTQIVSPIVRLTDLIDPLLGVKTSERPRSEASYTSIARQLKLKLEPGDWVFTPHPQQSARFEEWMAKQGYKGGEPLVIVYSTDSTSSRGWPRGRFADVSISLAANYGVRVLAADAPGSSSFTDEIGPGLPRDAIKMVSPSASVLVAALARASLLITDDAGVARFSARLGLPVIDIGGASVDHRAGAPIGVRGGTEAHPEDVYQLACGLLKKSRTHVLFDL